MRNVTCCLLVILFGSCLSSLGQKTSKLTSPQIVATYQRLNRTGAIDRAVLYDPALWGIFRVSLIMTLTEANGNGGSWNGVIEFKNGAGTVAEPSIILNTNVLNSEGSDVPIRVRAGAPITLSVTPTGDTSGSKYSVFVIVEQLM